MKRTGRTRLVCLALGLLAGGCSRQDVDKVGAMGRVVAEQARAAAPNNVQVDNLRPDPSPSQRVKQRLGSDVFLTHLTIDVVAEGDTIHLKGNVPSREHADRAVQLARDTIGVKQVKDELTTPE